MTCPHCLEEIDLAESCSMCHGDLRPLLRVSDFADWHFNRSLASPSVAAESLAITLAIRPGDEEAARLLEAHRSGDLAVRARPVAGA